MALIQKFTERHMDRNSIHDQIEASYTVFENDGRVFVQIDSYGREDRQIPGKKSQTIQLDRQGAEQLFNILKQAFRFS